MNDIMKEIKRLKETEGKYEVLKKFVDEKLNDGLTKIQDGINLLKEISPQSIGSRARMSSEVVDSHYAKVIEELMMDKQLSRDDIMKICGYTDYHQTHAIAKRLDSNTSVDFRKDGLKKIYFWKG